MSQQTPQSTENKIVLWIFEAPVRAAAPGIEAILTLTEDQKKRIGEVYLECYGTNEANLAFAVLRSKQSTLAQRESAAAILRNVQENFRSKAREIFTEEQRALIDKVYDAYNEVYKAAQAEMITKVKAAFSERLDKILTPEQKSAMKKAEAAVKAASEKPAQPQSVEGGNKKEQQ